jgi:hypothetical protein
MRTIEEVKTEMENLKTEKAVLTSKRDDILKKLKSKVGVSSIEAAVKIKPKIRKELADLEKQRQTLITKAEKLLYEIDDEEEED